MCEHGMNTDQMKSSMGQSESTLGLVEDWLDQSAHVAGHAERADVVDMIDRARARIDEARQLIARAIVELDASPNEAVTVERV
jgi:hypothetical protein